MSKPKNLPRRPTGILPEPRRELTQAEERRPAKVCLLCFDEARLEEHEDPDAALLGELLGRREGVVWVHVKGVSDGAKVAALGELFGLHELTVEDMLHVQQQAKVERYEDYYFLVLRSACVDRPSMAVFIEQLSICFGQGWVLSVEEGYEEERAFEIVRDALRANRRLLRRGGADMLCHALLDATIDAYHPLVAEHSDRLEALEDRSIHFQSQDPELIQEVFQLKKKINAISASLMPLRDDVSDLIREDSGLISEETKVYLRDCKDHVRRMLQELDKDAEICKYLMELHLSTINYHMNEVMKVLTIISTIFMPLSFIAGVYGMNFDTKHPHNMPELKHPEGYPIVLAVMGSITVLFLIFFYSKGWLGRRGFRSQRMGAPARGRRERR